MQTNKCRQKGEIYKKCNRTLKIVMINNQTFTNKSNFSIE